jgi:hypothetical protein
MTRLIIFAASLAIPMFLAACDTSPPPKGYSARFEQLEHFVQNNPIGQNGDYWLIKTTPIGSDQVGLIFGFPDNLTFCQELAEAQNKLYPDGRVSCERANSSER